MPKLVYSINYFPTITAPHFIPTCVRVHNVLRAKHGCPELSLDDDLCTLAQELAEQLTQRQYVTFAEDICMWDVDCLLLINYNVHSTWRECDNLPGELHGRTVHGYMDGGGAEI
jgi:hypothetical protein